MPIQLIDKVAGTLEVGHVDFEVILNLDKDRNGVGHLVFSPNQARQLADLLRKHADAVDELVAIANAKLS